MNRENPPSAVIPADAVNNAPARKRGCAARENPPSAVIPAQAGTQKGRGGNPPARPVAPSVP